MKLLLIFIGGGAGSVLRYLIAKIFSSRNFPYGTILVNISGSLLIGVVLGLSIKTNLISENQKLLLATGFCGGFTTFSTFTYESQVMLKSGDYMHFLLYTIGSFTLGIAMIFLGLYFTK